jgi:hypothetical protein
MLSGPPLPLPHDFPLRQLLVLVQQVENDLGVWLRGCGRELRVSITGEKTRCRVLISGDLGLLLGSCGRVAVRQGTHPVVLGANVLIGWRALQVVTGTPYLPYEERLNEVFPGAQPNDDGFLVPVESRTPEDVLADCLTHGIPVVGSRIFYRAPNTQLAGGGGAAGGTGLIPEAETQGDAAGGS